MTLEQRIRAFSQLGTYLKDLGDEATEGLYRQAQHHNNWFTEYNVERAKHGLVHMLRQEQLVEWCERYELSDESSAKEVGIVMAGNIPFVGFHDLLCILISGHKAAIKLSSQDQVLMKKVLDILTEIEPAFESRISKQERLNHVDAVIATGSDNTSRYFEYYFRHIPHIIRKNRTSVAVLSGDENTDQLKALADDLFLYFGLGCRNVSKVFIPKDYDIREAFKYFDHYGSVIDHHKYRNNYDYNKSLYLVNKVEHFDTGFSLWTQSEELVSPISVVFFEEYSDPEHLNQMITKNESKIQCIVADGWPGAVGFGEAQTPDLWDYADNVDTLAFLAEL